MKNLFKAIILAVVMFVIAAACENDTKEDTTYEQLQKIEKENADSTDGSEIKRPGGGNG